VNQPTPFGFSENAGYTYFCTLTITTWPNGDEDIQINQPVVDQPSFVYAPIVFRPSDQITVTADGCVQRGGFGKTWQRYVNPNSTPGPPWTSINPNNALYFGTVAIPFAWAPGPFALGITGAQAMNQFLLEDSSGFLITSSEGSGSVPNNVINMFLPENMPSDSGSFTPLTLTLGYIDNNGAYGDNGYWSPDGGANGECSLTTSTFNDAPVINGVFTSKPVNNEWGGPAWVNLHIVHDAAVGMGSAIPDPFDVVATQWDLNGYPLNPAWGWQVLYAAPPPPGGQRVPLVDEVGFQTWPSQISTGPMPSTFGPFSTQHPTLDPFDGSASFVGIAQNIIGGHWLCQWAPERNNQIETGHLDFSMATFTGLINTGIDRESWALDDDLDIDLDPSSAEPQYNPALLSPPFETGPQTPGGHGFLVHGEMKLSETLGNIGLSGWWAALGNSLATIGWGSTGELVAGHRAIMSGELALDMVHPPAYSEIHPIFGLAIEEAPFQQQGTGPFVNSGGFTDDTWALYARNQGSGGMCSQYEHFLNANDMTFEIPPPPQFIDPTTGSPFPDTQATMVLGPNTHMTSWWNQNSAPSVNTPTFNFFPGGQDAQGNYHNPAVTLRINTPPNSPNFEVGNEPGMPNGVIGEVEVLWSGNMVSGCTGIFCSAGSPDTAATPPPANDDDQEDEALAADIWNGMSAGQQAAATSLFAAIYPPPPPMTSMQLAPNTLSSAPLRPNAWPSITLSPNPDIGARVIAGLTSFCAATGGAMISGSPLTAVCASTPPVTTLSVSNSPSPGGAAATPDANGWYTAPIYVLPTAHSSSGSPIAYTTMTTIPAETEGSSQGYIYTAPSTAGVQLPFNSNNIAYSSADTAGNVEAVNFKTVKVAPEVSFIGSDSATQGNWIQSGKYGTDGSVIVNSYFSPPSYVAPVTTGTAPYTWNPAPTDVRALETNINGSRIASTWYTYNSMSVNFPVTDNLHHKLSVYFVDWDSSTRNETVQIVDTATNTILDKRPVVNFNGGIWLSWTISGNVTLIVQNNSSTNNAVLSGLFFDPLPEGTLPVIATTTPYTGAVYKTAPLSAYLQLMPSFSASSPVGLSSPPTMTIDGITVQNGVLTPLLGLGSHSFSIVATDVWGNQSITGGSFTVDPTNSTTGGHQICPTCTM
jgi:hypothetical protein